MTVGARRVEAAVENFLTTGKSPSVPQAVVLTDTETKSDLTDDALAFGEGAG